MNTNLKDNIIIPAWKIIQNDISIKKMYFFPWLLSIIFLTLLLVYQFIYTYVVIFWKQEEYLIKLLNFIHSGYLLEIIIFAVIFLILYLLIIPIFEWWLIKYIESKHKWENLDVWESIWLWIYKFFPLFEYNNLFSEFKFISVLNWYLFSIRFIWVEYIKIISYVFIVILLLSIVINILFAYTKYEIVLANKKTFGAIWSSIKIAVLNLRTTIKLYFLMFFLNIRVIFNFLIFLSFPIIIIITIWLITSKIFLFLAISILIILFIAFIIFLWYLTAVLEIFKTSLWYFAYEKWIEKLNKIQGELWNKNK